VAEGSERFLRVADGFTRRVEAVPDGAWSNPAPCEGWVARDVVRHLVEWMPAFFLEGWEVELDPLPSVDDDPAAAWTALRDALQGALDDPAVADRARDTPMGHITFDDAFGMAGTPDVLIHTWDLARATGLDETLDPEEVHRMAEAIEDVDDTPMRESGHYGPRVEVPADADEQTRLLAFMGRQV
jgi:uncharacterized protein (TIGR03086 family)